MARPTGGLDAWTSTLLRLVREKATELGSGADAIKCLTVTASAAEHIVKALQTQQARPAAQAVSAPVGRSSAEDTAAEEAMRLAAVSGSRLVPMKREP